MPLCRPKGSVDGRGHGGAWLGLLDEIRLGGPKVVALDILMGEPQAPRVDEGTNPPVKIEDDAELASSLGGLNAAYWQPHLRWHHRHRRRKLTLSRLTS